MSEKMFRATRDFSADYYGQRVEIHGGQSRVAPGHELVGRFPDYFEEIDVSGPGVRDLVSSDRTGMVQPVRLIDSTNRTPVAPWGPPSSVSAAASTAAPDTFRARVDAADNVWLGGPPRLPYRIALPHVEHGSISFAADVFGFSQGRECGGILIGWEDPDGVTVLDTTDDARGERNSARLEFEPAERRARELDCQVVGTWHTHDDAESTRPSPTDMRSLANMLLVHGLERCAGLVLTPHPTTGRPVFNTYITRRDGTRTIVEPAVIEVD